MSLPRSIRQADRTLTPSFWKAPFQRLRLTLTVKIAVYLLALTALMALLVLWQAERDTYELLLDLGKAQARVYLVGIEREIQVHSPNLNSTALESTIQSALTYEPESLDFRIEHIFIVDLSGRVIASNQPEHVGAILSDRPYLMQSMRENQTIVPDEITYQTPLPGETGELRPTLDVAMPLHIGDSQQPVGGMELEIDLTDSSRILKSRYWDDRRVLFGMLVVFVGGFGMLSFIVLRREIIRRIVEMGRAAKTVAQGNLAARVRPMGNDEIGALADTFNQMTDSLEQTIADLKRTQILAMAKLAELAEKRDPDTGAHLQRIPLYCRVLAQELRHDSPYTDVLTDGYIQALVEASPLHDIGKVGVPDSILLKPGPLTPDEFAIIREHPCIGADVLSGAEFLGMARDLALCHHERYDGSGYPNGLAGKQIPLSARIVALADMYDALTTKRAYKEAYSHEQAYAIIKEAMTHETASDIIQKEAGRRFDPNVMQAFLRCEDTFRQIRERFVD